MTGDIPLAEAQLIWNYEGKKADMPAARVMGIGGKDDNDYISSWGACNGDFADADDETKLLMLFRQFHWLVLSGEVKPKALHEALLVIPEYRKHIEPELLPRQYQDDD